MKKAIFGPADCEETIEFADNLPHYVSEICRRHGYEVNPEDITTLHGVRISSYNLGDGIAVPRVKSHRRAIRREIKDEIGWMKVTFV